jgi:phospholipid-binding lipoprotein MlaA
MIAFGRIIAAVLIGFVLAGCASTSAVEGSDVNDPLEGFNRTMFRVTLAVDRAVLRPTAVAYRDVFPQPVRDSLRNFLNNLNSPIVLANDILQGEANRAGVTLLRAGVNTTLGIGGLFDIAQRWGYQRHSEDFGQTLAVWGVPEGPYLFLPLFGPANPRDLTGYIADIFFDPITYAQWDGKIYFQIGRNGVDIIDLRARNIDTLDEIERTSLDYYASIRSLYRQTRNNEIMNGATQIQDLPDF